MIMKKKLANILSEIDLEIDEIDLYGYDIIPVSLAMVHRLQGILSDLRNDLSSFSCYGTSFTGYFIRFTKRFANLCIPVKRGRNIFLQKPKTGIVRTVVVFS